MEKDYTYWQDGKYFVGFLNDYPAHSTQGETLGELEEALVEIYEIRQEEKRHLVGSGPAPLLPLVNFEGFV